MNTLQATSQPKVATAIEARPQAALVRVAGWFGLLYVVAWVVGLFTTPSTPNAFAHATTVNRYFVDHNGATLTQAALVHGVAGLTLIVFAVGLGRYVERGVANRGAVRASVTCGVAAGLVSLVATQPAGRIALYVHVHGSGDTATTRSLFNAINKADTVKLVLLAGFIAAVCVAASRVRALAVWLIWLGVTAVVTLLVGGSAFPRALGQRWTQLLRGLARSTARLGCGCGRRDDPRIEHRASSPARLMLHTRSPIRQ